MLEQASEQGMYLKAARERKRLTQATLAEGAGVSERTVIRAENNDPISAESLRAICSVLEVDAVDVPQASAKRQLEAGDGSPSEASCQSTLTELATEADGPSGGVAGQGSQEPTRSWAGRAVAWARAPEGRAAVFGSLLLAAMVGSYLAGETQGRRVADLENQPAIAGSELASAPFRSTVLADGRLDLPDRPAGEVARWAQEAVARLNSYSFADAERVLLEASDSFSPKGYEMFREALERSHNLEAIRSRKLVLSTEVAGPATLIRTGLLDGRWSWQFDLPVTLTYNSVEGATVERMRAVVTVVRQRAINPARKQAIERIFLVSA